MNIFILDTDVTNCAQYHNDRHCVKMILETAQLLSTAHHEMGSSIAHKLYRKTHVNHPCSKWIRESKENYEWGYRLFIELCTEYTYRYGKVHKTFTEKAIALENVPDLPNVKMTPFTQCIPNDCKVVENAVKAYRNYYKMYKQHIAKWTKREIPYWWNEINII